VNSPSPDPEVDDIARELERYLSMHPTAADTSAGITRWWLAHSAQPALNRVEAALDLLVQRGLLQRKELPDGNSLYLSARRSSAAAAPSN
jgi:hypothetical protein